jgi:Putative Ig domain
MNQLCLNTSPCPGDLPLANFSSEVPDKVDYVTLMGPPGNPMPPIGGQTWSSRYCLGVCVSHTSQEDADLCAAASALTCLNQPVPPGGGSGGGGGYSRPDPNNPVAPVPPGTPTPPYPSLPSFKNGPQDCTVYCPDGTSHTESIPADSFVASNQGLVDGIAQKAACSLARTNLICFNSINKHVCLGGTYSDTVKVKGGRPPSSLPVDGTTGALPPGLELTQVDPLSATITGETLVAGHFEFDIIAQDLSGNSASHLFEIDVMGIGDDTDINMPRGQIHVAYEWQFEGDGGTGPYTFTASSEYLAWNLILDTDGLLHGTPTKAGQLVFTVYVKDATGLECQEEVTFNFDADPQTFNCCAEQSAEFLLGGYTGQQVPLSWAIVDGELPDGMDLFPLSANQAAIEGSPFPGGTYQIRLRTTDANDVPVDSVITINVMDILNKDVLPQCIVNVAYSAQLIGIGGQGDGSTYTFSRLAGPSFPTGLSMNSAGLITGTPTVQGTTTGIVIRITDNHGNFCNQLLDITVSPPPPVDFTAMTWAIISSTNDTGCPGSISTANVGSSANATATTYNALGGPCNEFVHVGVQYKGTLLSGANPSSQCRINIQKVLSAATTGAFATCGVTLRNNHGGIMYSVGAEGSYSFDFLWGDTAGGITVEIDLDAYNSYIPSPPPGVPFTAFSFGQISLSSHL